MQKAFSFCIYFRSYLRNVNYIKICTLYEYYSEKHIHVPPLVTQCGSTPVESRLCCLHISQNIHVGLLFHT